MYIVPQVQEITMVPKGEGNSVEWEKLSLFLREAGEKHKGGVVYGIARILTIEPTHVVIDTNTEDVIKAIESHAPNKGYRTELQESMSLPKRLTLYFSI